MMQWLDTCNIAWIIGFFMVVLGACGMMRDYQSPRKWVRKNDL